MGTHSAPALTERRFHGSTDRTSRRHPELIAAGETGELVPPSDVQALADAILRLARDASLRACMSAASRRRAVECFGIAQMVGRYTQLYDRELARRRARGVHAGAGLGATIE